MKSTDGGRTFGEFTIPGFVIKGNLAYLGGTELVVDGCLAGYTDIYTECGVLYSPDLGASATLYAHGPSYHINLAEGPWYIGNGTLLRSGKAYASALIPLEEQSQGLYRSTDKGISWTRFTILPHWIMFWLPWAMTWNQVEGPGSVLLTGGMRLDCDGSSSPGLPDSGVWKSTDNGASWRLVFRDYPGNYKVVSSIALSPTGQAVMSLDDGSLYWSTDAGDTWTSIPTPDGSQVWSVMYLGNHIQGN